MRPKRSVRKKSWARLFCPCFMRRGWGGDGLLNCQLFDHFGNPRWAEETCYKSQWFTTKHTSDDMRGREWPFSLLEGDCFQHLLTKLNFNWVLLFYKRFYIMVFFQRTCRVTRLNNNNNNNTDLLIPHHNCYEASMKRNYFKLKGYLRKYPAKWELRVFWSILIKGNAYPVQHHWL